MNSRLDEYVSLRGKCRVKFWFELFQAWWQKYPWRLPDNVEPPSDDPGKMMELARTGSGDEEEKRKVEEKLRSVSFLWEFSMKRTIDLQSIAAEGHHVVYLSRGFPKLRPWPRRWPLAGTPQTYPQTGSLQASLSFRRATIDVRGPEGRQRRFLLPVRTWGGNEPSRAVEQTERYCEGTHFWHFVGPRRGPRKARQGAPRTRSPGVVARFGYY